jgi:predicted phage-related endonuclease
VSAVQRIDCEQNSPGWYAARAGIPTGSCFATVQAEGRTKGTPSVTRRKYMLQLIGEQNQTRDPERYESEAMKRGHELEAEAVLVYELLTGNKAEAVGFLRQDFEWGSVGCSPDRLVGEDGILGVKTAKPEILYEWILAKRLPPEHVAQTQGELLISGRQWFDFIGYWPGLPLFIHRVYPDAEYHKNLLAALQSFHSEMRGLAKQIEEAA